MMDRKTTDLDLFIFFQFDLAHCIQFSFLSSCVYKFRRALILQYCGPPINSAVTPPRVLCCFGFQWMSTAVVMLG